MKAFAAASAWNDWGFLGALLGVLSLLAFVTIGGLLDNFPPGIYQTTSEIFVFGAAVTWFLLPFRPFHSLALLLILLPLGARLSEFFSPDFLGVVVTLDVLVLWITSVLVLLALGFRKGDRMLAVFMAFVGAAAVSSLVNMAPGGPTIILCGILPPFLIYLMIVKVVDSAKRVKGIIAVLNYTALLCALFAMAQPLINGRIMEFFYIRFASVFYNPIIFANVLTLLWPFLLVFEPFGSGNAPKWTLAIRGLALIVVLGSLLLTGSRGAMVICALQGLWLSRKIYNRGNLGKRRSRLLLFLGLVMMGSALIYNREVLVETVFRRFTQVDFAAQGNSAHERMLGFKGGVEIGLANPLFGVGLGNFRYAYPHTSTAASGTLELESAHNFIVNLFAEMGASGLILWLALLAIAFVRIKAAKSWVIERLGLQTHSTILCAFVGYTATQGLFYGEFIHKSVGLPMVLYFTVIGLLSTLYFMGKEHKHA